MPLFDVSSTSLVLCLKTDSNIIPVTMNLPNVNRHSIRYDYATGMHLRSVTFFQIAYLRSVFLTSFPVLICIMDLCCLSILAQDKQAELSRKRHTILMADERAMLYHAGLKQVLHIPERHQANPVIANDRPWEMAIAYCTIHRDEETGRYQCWYQSYAGGRAKNPTRRVVLCYATSQDGLVWEKPKLGLFDFNGDPDTNIVLVGNGGLSVNYGASVLFDALDPDPGRRYKLAYWDFTERGGQQIPGLCVAFSDDGLHWTKYPLAPLLQGAYGDPTQAPLAEDAINEPTERPAISDVMDLMWDPLGKQYVIYSKTWIDGSDGRRFWKRAVVRTTSKDFVHWTRPELLMSPTRQEDGQFHGASVFYHQGLYLGLLQRLDFGGFDTGGTGNMPIELIWSEDGLKWNRPFTDLFFMPINKNPDAFDAGCLWTCSTPVHLENTTRLYYGAYPGWNADLNAATTGVGMMSIPKDRWIGMVPVDEVGQLTLKPVFLDKGTRITLNADASGGEIRSELIYPSGYRVKGFTGEQVVPFTEDNLEHSVRWKSDSLDKLKPGFYQIRIHLRNATLYALSLDTSSFRKKVFPSSTLNPSPIR